MGRKTQSETVFLLATGLLRLALAGRLGLAMRDERMQGASCAGQSALRSLEHPLLNEVGVVNKPHSRREHP